MASPSSEVVRTWRMLPSLKLALERAADPTTRPDELTRLADHAGKAVRRLVAQNPNAPGEALDRLVSEMTAEVAENPGLPLLVLADPRLSWLSFHSAWCLCACPSSPGWLLVLLATRGPLAFDEADLPPWLRGHTPAVSHWWRAFATNPGCCPEVLSLLMASEDPELRALAASHLRAP